MALSATTIYIATTIASIVIAFLLIVVSRSSNPIKTSPLGFKRRGQTASAGDEGIRDVILGQLGPRIDARGKQHEIADALSQVFDKELDRRLEAKQHELTTHYEKLVEQKTQNEEIAWKKYERVLSQKRDTDAVIRSVAQGLVVVDARGKVIMMNPAAEKLLGKSRKEKLGHSIAEGLTEDQMVSMVQKTSDNDEREIELLSQADETKKVLRASSAVIENENGQAVGMVSVLSDITKQKELDNLKANFVANVSHELRTPLIAIDKSIALILSGTTGTISPEQQQFLNIAERNLKRLSRLINDLLDLSKLEAGKMALKREDSALARIIAESVEGLENWAQAKKVSIVQTVDAHLPVASVDPDRIVQVLTNLIGNAIKFTPEGKKITVAAGKSGAAEITVSVSDEGVGIPPDAVHKIFDKFYQVGGERVNTDIHGTGIGLSICKEIVERHGGRIWVESSEGAGTTFHFTVPCAEGAHAAV